MVLINGIKYACERCIRGHRVTTCNHTDQPLMMIKPKGRPSTTCAYCKELRKSKGVTPPGSCTCGRQEKKRLAQKAKEEARMKAKELAAKNCVCSKSALGDAASIGSPGSATSKVSCPVHSKKSKRTSSQRKSKPRAGAFPRVNSSTSLDSNVLSASSILSDNSNNLASSFIDSDILSGKISKDYHHVPSLASISSMQSSNSLEQNIASPQSPTLGGMQFNFITGTFNQPTTSSSLHNSITGSRNWDAANGKSNGSIRSNSQVNLNGMGMGMGMGMGVGGVGSGSGNSFTMESPPMNNRSALASPPLKPNAGGVIVPLEEFVPPDLNGVGKITDSTSYVNDWMLNGGNGADARSLRDNVSQNDSPKSSLMQSVTSNDADDYSSSQLGKAGSERQTTQGGNGLLDMFLDSSSISTLSKANVLLQDKGSKGNRSHSGSIDKNKLYGDSFMSTERTKSQRTTSDADSVRSVEVLSLTPSFMDIPNNYMNSKRKARPNREQSNGQPIPIQNKPRSTSIDQNHKYTREAMNALNPMVGNSMYDAFDLPSDGNNNSVTSSNINNMGKYQPLNNSNNIDAHMFNNNHILPNDMIQNNMDISPSHTMDMNNLNSSEASPMNPIQFSSPPSQLLSEQGFADLDNFMSTL